MAKLSYITNTTLDGYIEDAAGSFDWSRPEGVFEAVTGLLRPMRAFLYGRRLYESMCYWAQPVEHYRPEQRAFARIWQGGEKIVYSRTLTAVTTPHTRLERDFDAERVRALKQTAAGDLGIGGAEIASAALAAGLIDECHLFIHPVFVGRGKPAIVTAVHQSLALLAATPLATGTMHLHYAVRAR